MKMQWNHILIIAMLLCLTLSAQAQYLQADKLDILGRPNDPELVVALQITGQKIPRPSLTQLNHSYGYAGQNPVNFVDPLGLILKYGPQYSNTVNTIKNNGGVGAQTVNNLEDSDKTYNICEPEKCGSPYYDPATRKIYMCPGQTGAWYGPDGKKNPLGPDDVLIHEMGHADRHDQGQDIYSDSNPSSSDVRGEENNVVNNYDKPYGSRSTYGNTVLNK